MLFLPKLIATAMGSSSNRNEMANSQNYIYTSSQLCWDICIRWHKNLKMLRTNCGLPTLKKCSLILWWMNNKRDMEHGIFKSPAWLSMTNALNEQTGKSFRPKQLHQKHNRLRSKQKKWSQLLSHTGLGQDETTQTVITSEEV